MAPNPCQYAGGGCLVFRRLRQPPNEFRVVAIVATGAAPQFHRYTYGTTRLVRMGSESTVDAKLTVPFAMVLSGQLAGLGSALQSLGGLA